MHPKLITYILFLIAFNLSAQSSRMELIPGEENCCFTLSYELSPADQFNTFEITLPPGDEFSTFNLALNNGWISTPLTNGDGFLIYRPDLANLPANANDFLIACLDLPPERNATNLTIGWSRDGGQVQVTETLPYNCYGCNLPLQDSIVCHPDGGYDYLFRFTNQSEFTVNELRFWEDGLGDFIEAESLELSNAVPPGETSDWVQLRLNATAESFADICFSITTSRRENGDYLECCTGYYCIKPPKCDRCCTEYTIFEENVNDGFRVDFNNGNTCDSTQMTITPRSLTDCDQTLISRRNLLDSGGIAVQSSGNQSVIFPSLTINGQYEICMEVTRQDLDSMACYETASLMICDTVLVDCIVSTTEEKNTAVEVNVFPNPTTDLVKIDSPTQRMVSIIILDFSGKQLFKEVVQPTESVEVSLGQFPSGIYLLSCQFDNGRRKVIRMVKQ